MTTEELLKQRGNVYGDVRDNMNCSQDFLLAWNTHRNSEADIFTNERDRIGYMGCIGMVFHKLARICTGNHNHYDDNYNDIAGYIELARQIAKGEYNK